MHNHRAESTRTVPFSGPVNVVRQPNPRAHGNITEVRICKCGSVQKINRNQGHVERGQWQSGE